MWQNAMPTLLNKLLILLNIYNSCDLENAFVKTKPILLKALALLALRNIYLIKKFIVFVLFDMAQKKQK